MGFNAKTDWKLNDTVMPEDLNRIEEGIKNSAEKTELKAVQKFQLAGGTSTGIILSDVIFEDRLSKTFIVRFNNNQMPTTINGKSLYKPGTSVTPNLKAGKAVTVWYDATNDCFFIKASAEGDAIAENVLAEKTFSNDDDTGIVGTMVDNGPVSAEIIDLSTEGAEYTIAKGFHSGLRKIRAKISGLVASVIKSGTNVGGITGTFTSDATAVAGDILSGKTAYKNGSKLTGTMVDRGTVNHSLAINGSYTIPAGKHSGSGKVTQNIPTKGAETITPGTSDKTIPSGRYLTGTQTIKGDANLIPANILQGKSIFGVAGSVIAGKKFASGQVESTNAVTFMQYLGTDADFSRTHYAQVSGLTFKPTMIIIFASNPANYLAQYIIYMSSGAQTNLETGFIVSIYTGYYANPYNQAVYSFKPNARDLYVNATGFKLPAPAIGGPNYWFAWE